eukprot:SAG31_NODE_3430_length_4261_cov_2.188382_1_plen_130_part_00
MYAAVTRREPYRYQIYNRILNLVGRRRPPARPRVPGPGTRAYPTSISNVHAARPCMRHMQPAMNSELTEQVSAKGHTPELAATLRHSGSADRAVTSSFGVHAHCSRGKFDKLGFLHLQKLGVDRFIHIS